MSTAVLKYPASKLRKKTAPVEKIGEEIFQLIDKLVEIMLQEDGVGLAANQIGSEYRIFVMNAAPSEEQPEPVAFINPVVLNKEGEVVDEEGCLSFPELYLRITRPEKVRVYAKSLYNEGFVLDLTGILARAAMHELDHLDGVLFIDHAADTEKEKVEKYVEDIAEKAQDSQHLMKILLFGSTDFSLPIAQCVHEEFEILGVVISKPRPRGRGLRTSLPRVAQWAKNAGLNVYMPDDPNSDDFIKTLSQMEPDIFVLSAYGYILSRRLLQVARSGGINIHPSLLPRYRGAAPIQRAIMDGEDKTGITIFFMDEKIDHGDMLAQQEIPIEKDDTFGSLADKLANLGADMIIAVLRAAESGNCPTTKQQSAKASYAPKLKKEELIIDWQREAVKIHDQIRALSPRPGARTYFRKKELMITRAELGDRKLLPGLLAVEDKKLYVGAGNRSLVLREVKPEGRKVISALDFINGYRIEKGEVLR